MTYKMFIALALLPDSRFTLLAGIQNVYRFATPWSFSFHAPDAIHFVEACYCYLIRDRVVGDDI